MVLGWGVFLYREERFPVWGGKLSCKARKTFLSIEESFPGEKGGVRKMGNVGF